MKIYDISRTISEDMTVYKNKESKKIKRIIVAKHETDSYAESRIEMDMHCGTHIDAPLHMIDGGKTVDMLNLYDYIGKCKLFDLSDVEETIHIDDIAGFDISNDDIVIFKTKNSYESTYNPKFVYIGADAAEYLANTKIRTVGIDAMSVERDNKEHPTHKILLSNDIAIIEDLYLADVDEGEYLLCALPLKIQNSDASPVRAILIKI